MTDEPTDRKVGQHGQHRQQRTLQQLVAELMPLTDELPARDWLELRQQFQALVDQLTYEVFPWTTWIPDKDFVESTNKVRALIGTDKIQPPEWRVCMYATTSRDPKMRRQVRQVFPEHLGLSIDEQEHNAKYPTLIIVPKSECYLTEAP